MARGRGTGKRSGSKPTSAARTKMQDVKERYTKAREDAQLLGLIPTTPEAALRAAPGRSEVVDPTTQSDVPQPKLVEQAVRNGWAVPEHRKPDLVDELLAIVNSADPEVSTKVRVAAFNALRMADQQQWERDHPREAAALRGAGGAVNVNNTTNVVVGEVFNDIEKLKKSYELITGTSGQTGAESARALPNGEQAESEAACGVRADGDAKPVDEAEPYNSEEEPEAD